MGNWTASYQQSIILEKWMKDQQTYQGKADVFNHQTLSYSEEIEIYADQNNWYYCPNINGNKIPFRMIESSQNSFTAINLKNEFPQIIAYQLITPDSLMAFIAGFENHLYKQKRFYYKK
jgi:hypothetical protein